MIGWVVRGWGAARLVAYLFGPGRHNEHTDQHVVAVWDDQLQLHQPPSEVTDKGVRFDTTALAAALTDPAVAAGILPGTQGHGQGPVWHCSLRTAPGDRELTDAEWAEIASDVMHRTGIAPRGDPGGCRWVAVRHAPDHIHIAAVLVRQDTLRRVSPRLDYHRVRDACLAAEAAHGLQPTTPIDRTAPRNPDRGETAKAARVGLTESPRDHLRHVVRTAAAAASTLEEFFDLVTADAVVRLRVRTDAGGRPVGYAVAYSNDRIAPWELDSLVWFGGRSLAADLSLPKLVERFATATALPPPVVDPARRNPLAPERAAALAAATEAVDQARQACVAAGRADPGIAHATGDMLLALAKVAHNQGDPLAAAVLFERAARHPGRGQPAQLGQLALDLRTASRRLARVGLVDPTRKFDGPAVATLVLALAALIVEIAAWRAHHRQLTAAAQAAASSHTLTNYAAKLPFPRPPAPVAAPARTTSAPSKAASCLGPRPVVRTQAPHQRPRTR